MYKTANCSQEHSDQWSRHLCYQRRYLWYPGSTSSSHLLHFGMTPQTQIPFYFSYLNKILKKNKHFSYFSFQYFLCWQKWLQFPGQARSACVMWQASMLQWQSSALCGTPASECSGYRDGPLFTMSNSKVAFMVDLHTWVCNLQMKFC